MYKFYNLVTGLLIALFPQVALAAPDPMSVTLCMGGIFGVGCNTDAVAADADSYLRNITLTDPSGRLFQAFAAALFFMCVIYGIKLAATSYKDGAMSEAIQAYVQAFIGATVVGGAFVLGNSIANDADHTIIVDTEPIKDSIFGQIASFLITIVTVVVIANIIIQGIRMISALNEGSIETARKNFIQSLAGGAIVMIVVPVFNAITGLGSAGGIEIQTKIVQIANFLGTIFGVLAVIAFIVAGIMLIVSVNDSLRDRARSLMIASLIAIICVVAALGIVQFLI